MDSVVGKVEEEGLFTFHYFGNVLLGLNGESFREKGIGPVILVEVRHGMMSAASPLSVILFCIVTSGSPEGCSSHIDVEAKAQGFGTFMIIGPK